MSTEHLIKSHSLPRTFREMSSHIHGIFRTKLSCIICNTSLDTNTQEHSCILRPENKDVIIRNRQSYFI